MVDNRAGVNTSKGLKAAKNSHLLGYFVVAIILLALLVLGLYGVSEYKAGRFAWMSHDQSRFLNKLKARFADDDELIGRMVPIHDRQPSRFKEFGSELEQDCYLAFAGRICGYQVEAMRAQNMASAFLGQVGSSNPSEQVQACAKGMERFQKETREFKSGMPHCLTVHDIVKHLPTQPR